MVNAWSLAGSIMNGTFEEDYPLMDKEKYIYESPDGGKTVTRRKPFSDKREVIQGDYFEEIPWSDVEDKRDKDLDWIAKSGGFEWTPGSPWPPEVPDEEACNGDDYDFYGEAFDHMMGMEPLGYGNTAAYDNTTSASQMSEKEIASACQGDWMADVDDQYSHHFGQNTVPPYITKTFKYEEDVILKQAEDYIAKTYELHYTSDKGNYQTLDLIESIGDAEAFCRSNAIKYLSRFGKKDGKNRKDILKAIHYCTLLYHFSFNDDSN